MPANKARIEDLLDELARGARTLRVFSHLGCEDSLVSSAAHHVLKIVSRRQPIHAAAVALQLGIGPAAMSRHVAELEQAGLVQRVSCQSDARRQLLTVTEAGEQLVAGRDRARGKRLARLLPGWDGTRMDAAIEVLGELNDAMVRGVEQMRAEHESKKGNDAR